MVAKLLAANLTVAQAPRHHRVAIGAANGFGYSVVAFALHFGMDLLDPVHQLVGGQTLLLEQRPHRPDDDTEILDLPVDLFDAICVPSRLGRLQRARQ